MNPGFVRARQITKKAGLEHDVGTCYPRAQHTKVSMEDWNGERTSCHARGSAALPRRDAAAGLQDSVLLVGEDMSPRNSTDVVS